MYILDKNKHKSLLKLAAWRTTAHNYRVMGISVVVFIHSSLWWIYISIFYVNNSIRQSTRFYKRALQRKLTKTYTTRTVITILLFNAA